MSPTAAGAATWAALGTSIRARRQARGMTLVDLAGAAALSQPFLSQVENGRARPSMPSLYRIASALGTTPQALVGEPAATPPRPVVVRHADVAPIDAGAGTGSTAVARLLLGGAAPFHVVEYDGLPSEFLEPWRHDGFEAVYVVAGVVELDVDGALTTLHAGDSVSYPAHLAHRLRDAGRPPADPARVLIVETGSSTVDPGGRRRRPSHAPAPARRRRPRPR